jgi:4'-phosphopantetheinyl transferase EntD
MLFQDLVDPLISVREAALAGFASRLLPDEMVAVAAAGEKRRREFAAGRTLAREAFAALGLPSVAVPAGSDRAPIWPNGVVGSISHSSTWCVAAIALQSDGFISIGVDLEESIPLDEIYATDICTRLEKDWLDRQPIDQKGLLLRALFSAKECAYKCQYPLTKTLLGYDAIRIELDVHAKSFRAIFEIDVDPFAAGDRLDGRIAFEGGHIASAMALR